jgi:hypothetical protein
MSESSIEFRFDKQLPLAQVLALYRACHWSAADKPDELLMALAGSDNVVPPGRVMSFSASATLSPTV